MFEFLKKIFYKNNIQEKSEVKEYIPSQSESVLLIKLNEQIEEISAAYHLVENRVKSYISQKNKEEKNHIGVINSLNLFHEEILSNIRFMTNNNENQVYNELIVRFNELKIRFENLIDAVNKEQENSNDIIEKCN